jgi:hypothetical protein
MRPAVLIITFAWAVLAGPILGAELWQASPAGPHHQAVVRVLSNGRMGSGCYVRVSEQLAAVATARHCVGQQPSTIVWADGSRCQGTPCVSRDGADVACLIVDQPPAGIQPLPVATEAPQSGTWVEWCGYGGPEKQPWHWWAYPTGALGRGNALTVYSAAVMAGDSGGPVLDQEHRLVGVVSVGIGEPIKKLDGIPIYRQGAAVAQPYVGSFLSRIAASPPNFAVGGCAGGSCGRGSSGGRGAYFGGGGQGSGCDGNGSCNRGGYCPAPQPTAPSQPPPANWGTPPPPQPPPIASVPQPPMVPVPRLEQPAISADQLADDLAGKILKDPRWQEALNRPATIYVESSAHGSATLTDAECTRIAAAVRDGMGAAPSAATLSDADCARIAAAVRAKIAGSMRFSVEPLKKP